VYIYIYIYICWCVCVSRENKEIRREEKEVKTPVLTIQ
jgi:hypothetical protein